MFEKTVSVYQKILHIRFQDAFINYPPKALNLLSPENFWRRVLKVLLYAGGRLIPNLFKPEPKNENLYGKIWLYVLSQNNYDALSFLKGSLPEAVIVAGQNKEIGRYNKQVNRLSLRWKLFYTLKFFPVWFGFYKRYGKHAIRFFDLIFISIGYYESYLHHLKKHKPRCIIFTNDHNDDSRAMLFAAKELKIPTVYIQHASVSTSFPPLEFDLSLLEGQDALEKYRQCGPVSGEVKLIGMPKADSFFKYRNFKKTTETIGICSNRLDDYLALKKTITALSQHFPELRLIFRPHPNDHRDFSFVHNLNNGTISDTKTETAFEFLRKTDAVIAADSSILLEAVLMNINGIYYRFGESNLARDYYGYVKKGLVQEAYELPELVQLVSNMKEDRPEVYKRAAYFNATAGTQWEGRSNELAVKFINEFLRKNISFTNLLLPTL